MSFDQMRAISVFTRVVELGSFTRAAESLHLPKASVTQWVKALEEHLGVRLLQRTTRRLSVTDDGVAYLEGARAVVDQLAELDANVRRARMSPKGRLRVDVPASAGRHVLAPALPDFFKRYPDVQVELGSSDRPVDLILEGVDCVIRGGTLFDEMLVAKPLCEFDMVTCASPAYLKRAGTPKHPNDLAEHTFVNFFSAKTGRVFALDFERSEEKISMQGKHAVAANDADTHVAMGIAGLGVLQLPRTDYVTSLLKQGLLKPILPQWRAGTLPLFIMYPRNRHLSARVRAFVDWAVALYATQGNASHKAIRQKS